MLLIAVAIKLTSRGPILYRQTRIGLDRRRPGRAGGNTRRHVDYGGRPFTIYKFRTMYVDRSDGNKQVWARQGEAPGTPLRRPPRPWRVDGVPPPPHQLPGGSD